MNTGRADNSSRAGRRVSAAQALAPTVARRRRVARVVEVGEVALGVEGRGAAGAGGGDRLAVVVVDEVAGRRRRPGGWCAVERVVDQHVALVVEVDLAVEQLGARVVADGDEQAGGVELAGLAGDGVAQGERRSSLSSPWISATSEFQANSIFGSAKARSCMILEARSSSRRWIRVTLRAEAGQERRLLDRGVATADDGDVLLAEEEAVAGRTPADAVAGEPVLVGQAELAVARAHRQDHGARGEGALGGA